MRHSSGFTPDSGIILLSDSSVALARYATYSSIYRSLIHAKAAKSVVKGGVVRTDLVIRIGKKEAMWAAITALEFNRVYAIL